jgi:hypothetical protein
MTTLRLTKSEQTNHSRFYSTGDEGIVYNTVEEIADFIYDMPHKVEEYSESMVSLANVHAAWGDFRGMRETLNFMVDVRVRVAELRGQSHLK